MIELVFPEPEFRRLTTYCRESSYERAALMLVTTVACEGRTRLLVRDVRLPSEGQYDARSATNVSLQPELVTNAVYDALNERRGIVFVHSHPFEAGTPHFSSVDDATERAWASYLSERAPDLLAASLLVGANGCRARVLGTNSDVRVVALGSTKAVVYDAAGANHKQVTDAHLYERQIRAFGPLGQSRLAEARVAIVGLGGTGSLVAQLLAHLGVERFLLVDPDVVESSNLNRIASASETDIGALKVHVSASHIQRLRSRAQVETVAAGVHHAGVGARVAQCDFIFGCTDSQGSRALLSQIAYQYLIPYIDVGVAIVSREGNLDAVAGRIQLLSPGLGCYVCGGLLDWDVVRRDLMDDVARQADPYFIGEAEPQPAVMSINATVTSLATTMFLGVLVGLPTEPRCLFYDALSGRLRDVEIAPKAGCVVCSLRGGLSRGDEWPLPVRQ